MNEKSDTHSIFEGIKKKVMVVYTISPYSRERALKNA